MDDQTPLMTQSAPVKLSLVDRLCARLNADKTDLVSLLIPINAKKVGKKHIAGVLRQSYERLQALRGDLSQAGEHYQQNRKASEQLNQLRRLLSPGADSISLDQCLESIDNALESLPPSEVKGPDRAWLFGIAAKLAQLNQDHSLAGHYYDQALSCAELSSLALCDYYLGKALVFEDLGRDFGVSQSLNQAISILEKDALPLVSRETDIARWCEVMTHLGDAQGILGQRQGGTRNLENAIATLEKVVSATNGGSYPEQWGKAQNSLGNTLGVLGHRHNDEPMLGRAILAFEQALEVRQQATHPHEWAITKNNLAAALQSVGQRKKDSKILKQSVEAYRSVLSEWTRELAPLDWANTMNNLGSALRLLGEHRKGPRTLEQSVAAYHSALSERSREQFPDDWAMTQNNLGAALQTLAEREEKVEPLTQAVTAYESALTVWTRDHAPMSWAMTMANLGVARRTLAEVTNDYEEALRAVEEIDSVSDAFREASHAQYSELIIDQLAQARKLAEAIRTEQSAEPMDLKLHPTPDS